MRPIRSAMGRTLGLRWRRQRYTRLEEVGDLRLVVTPGVFLPSTFRSGVVLAIAAADEVRRRAATGRAPRVLDLGTGSGASAIHAARAGGDVLAVDINPAAVACARINASLHGLEDRVEVRRSDLFDDVRGRFDVVMFNPPFFIGVPRSDRDRAWRGEGIFERFVTGLPDVLSDAGEALVLLSTDGACADLLEGMLGAGLTVAPISRRRWLAEVQTVYRVGRG